MKKGIMLIVLMTSLFAGSSLKAQLLSAGVEGAVTTSSVRISDIKNEFTDAIKGTGILGFEAGFFARSGIGPVYIKPKLLLDYQGGTLQYNLNQEEQNVTFRAGKLLVPVLVGFKFI